MLYMPETWPYGPCIHIFMPHTKSMAWIMWSIVLYTMPTSHLIAKYVQQANIPIKMGIYVIYVKYLTKMYEGYIHIHTPHNKSLAPIMWPVAHNETKAMPMWPTTTSSSWTINLAYGPNQPRCLQTSTLTTATTTKATTTTLKCDSIRSVVCCSQLS